MNDYVEPPPPVKALATMRDGRRLVIQCWSFDIEATPWRFLSWARGRGRKELKILNPSDVTDITIEAPEDMFATRPHAASTPPDANQGHAFPLRSAEIPPSPREEINPVMERIRGRVKDNGALVSVDKGFRGGRPASEVVTDVSEGKVETVSATMA